MIKNISDFRETISLIKDNKGGTLRQIKIEVSAFVKDAAQIDGSVAVLKEELTCGICFEIVLQTCITSCKHVFCKFCVEMSLLQRVSCPLCRCNLSETSQRRLLPKADRVIETVMLKVDPDYDSWSQKEIIERESRYCDGRKKKQYNNFDDDRTEGDTWEWDGFEDDLLDFVTGDAEDDYGYDQEELLEGEDIENSFMSFMSDSEMDYHLWGYHSDRYSFGFDEFLEFLSFAGLF